MSGVFQNIIDGIAEFQRDLDTIILDLVFQHEEFILDLVRETQLYQGLDGKGKRIEPEYKESTIRYKKRRNQPYNRVTLKDKEDFYRSFFLFRGSDFFNLQSTDQKRIYLEKKYGDEIYWISDENINLIIEKIKDDLFEMFVRKLS